MSHTTAFIIYVTLQVIGVAYYISQIGKTPKPNTATGAAISFVLSVLFTAAWYWALNS